MTMEGRLFFIGCAMGLFAWATKRLKNQHALNAPARTGLWHGLFCALSAFSVLLVLLVTWEDRLSWKPTAPWPLSDFAPAFAAAVVAGILGFWRGRTGDSAKRRYFVSEDLEWAETVFSAVLLAATIMYFVIQAFKIPSGSMERTLEIGDHLFVNKFLYGLRVPFSGKRVLRIGGVRRGDVIVFSFPDQNPAQRHCGASQYRKDFIKRVVGVPGDTIEVHAGRLIRDGQYVGEEPYSQYKDGSYRQPASIRAHELSRADYQKLWEVHKLDMALQEVQRDEFGPVIVPPDEYFAMGDNRDRSCDSRYWGPVDIRDIKGKAWFIYWPPARMRVLP